MSCTRSNCQGLTFCVSRSFAHEIKDCDLLCEQVANFAESAAAKLREQDSLALEMAAFAFTNRFKEEAPQTFGSHLAVFPDGSGKKVASSLKMAVFADGGGK